jgi:hypothetical protein
MGAEGSISADQLFFEDTLAPGAGLACRSLLRLRSSDDEPFVEVVEDADEQVVDMSAALSAFLAGVDLVESEVVGLRTATATPREEICWW